MLNPTSGQLLLYLKMIYETVLNQSSSMFLSRGLWLDWLLLGHLVETSHGEKERIKHCCIGDYEDNKMQLFWISNVMLNPTSGQLLLYLKMIYETVLNQSSSMFLSRGLWLDWLLLGHLVETGHV